MPYNPRRILRRMVIKQLPDESILEEVASQGAQAGFPGFRYTEEILSFFTANKEHIFYVLSEEAGKLGMTVPELIASWGVDTPDYPKFATLMSWFALEITARDWAAEELTS